MKKNGFTLIELLISTAILTFMITAMTIALQEQQKQFNLTKEIVDIDQTGRAILDLIATDLRNSASRQGKNVSIQFVNGGSDLSGGENSLTGCATGDTNSSGQISSPADCITVTTWDITRGMTADPLTGTTNLPSVVGIPTLKSQSGGSFNIELPNQWFDSGGNFIGGLPEDNTITLGFRSRTALCSSDNTVNCSLNPELCSECSAIIRGTVSNRDFIVNEIDDVLVDNFPVNFASIGEFVSGVQSGGVNYGFTSSISSQTSEVSIASIRTYRLDLQNRELELLQNGGNAQPIAGGQGNTPGGLESPGIVDLQFVFNLQNPDGTITRVGSCNTDDDGEISNCPCSDLNTDLNQQNFACDDVNARERDIRSVEIYLVLKSKIQSEIKKSETFKESQSIPQIADVSERTVEDNDGSDAINEPEGGFIYRVYSTTVYLRNMAREDFA